MKSVLRKAGRFFAADKKRWNFFWLNCLKQSVRIDGRPSSVNEVDSFPPRGSLDVRQGFTFLPKKMKFAEFFSGKGKALKADNFCLIERKHDEARGSLGTRQTIFDVLQ